MLWYKFAMRLELSLWLWLEIMFLISRLVFVLWSTGLCLAVAPNGPWDKFNLAPKSRTVYPTAIHSTSGFGDVADGETLVGDTGKVATLTKNGTWIALDFGTEVGPLTSFI